MNAHVLQEFMFLAQSQLSVVWLLAVMGVPALVGGIVYGIGTQRMEREGWI